MFLRKFDLLGICMMICGSCTPVYYYGFSCPGFEFYQAFYIAQVWIFCFVALYVSLRPAQKDFKKIWVLATAWIIAGYSTGPGLIHLTVYLDPKYLYAIDFNAYAIGGTIYAGGAVIYALKFPERFFKGRFDNVGNSHNIFHVCCLIGAIWHWKASFTMFHERQLFVCPI